MKLSDIKHGNKYINGKWFRGRIYTNGKVKRYILGIYLPMYGSREQTSDFVDVSWYTNDKKLGLKIYGKSTLTQFARWAKREVKE